MKKSTFFLTILTGSFLLAGCNFDIGFLKIGDAKKEEKIEFDVNPDNENYVDPSKEEDDSPSNPISEVSFEYMKNYVTQIAAALYDIDESEVTFGTYGKESDEYPDIYLYNESNLMFVDLDLYFEDYELTEAIEELKSYLPADFSFLEDVSEMDDDYGTYDLWFSSGAYYYVIYAEDWYSFIWATFDIVPQSQVDAYKELVYSDESSDFDDDDDDWDWDDGDWDFDF